MKSKSYTIINVGANLLLALSVMLVCLLWFIIYNDWRIDPPLHNVSAVSELSVYPGEIATIKYTYSRTVVPEVNVLERWLFCDNGSIWPVTTVRDIGDEAWPVGQDVTATLRIKIPEGVPENQTCYYSSKVQYPRTILHDIVLKLPSIDVPIIILGEGDE